VRILQPIIARIMQYTSHIRD